jgi:SAM-dependent methyltransferase
MEWFFKRMAHEYSFKVIPTDEHPFRTYQAQFLDHRLDNENIVVDLGCKYGEISKRIAPLCKQVIGIDHDMNAINIANSKNQSPNIQYVCNDLFVYLDNHQQKVDVILLSHVLEHIDNPENLLKQLSSYTRFLYIELPDFESNYMNDYRSKLNLYLNYEDEDHISEFDRKHLMKIIEDSGFKIIECEYRNGMMRFWCGSAKSV